jgi:leucyl-tRNA synthetase
MEHDYKPHEIEQKWQKNWTKSRIFQAEPNERQKFFITIPYPYLNGNLHAGHTRTFTIGDVVARHKRMLGYNVLYPMGFHVTGTPIVGLAELIASRDPQTMDVYEHLHGIPKDILPTLETPENVVDYFKHEAEKAMRMIGYSIDWRRKFTTTDPTYKKFIQWQYIRLAEKNLIVKGSHPLKWCPNDNNPVEDHDILHGEGATIVEYTLIKFRYKDLVFPCATLRPETTYGVTNIWVNPNVDYLKIRVEKNGCEEFWVVSREAFRKLTFTDRKVEYIEDIPAKSLVGIKLTNPITGDKIISLPASFVRPENGSGIVMSVPAHAPFDYLALRDLYDADLHDYGITEDLKEIKLLSLIKVPEFGEFPAKEIVESMGITSQSDKRADEATKIVYRREFHGGILKKITGKYAGCSVSKIKDILTRDLISSDAGELFYELSEPVVCRCGTPCVVNMVKDQWFLNYSDPEWKSKVYKCLSKMRIIPEDYRVEFENKVDWLKDKACARKKGLGTRLPLDKEWLIESLGDSTIYMSYYIIAKFIEKGALSLEQLTLSFFDYILLGKGNNAAVSAETGIESGILEEICSDFTYWYPVDLRSSGKDLVPNHLLFFLFHHVALFGEENWPKALAVNGFVSLEGQKMSKSKGPILTMESAVRDYGADITRMYILSTAEQTQDADWHKTGIESTRKQVDKFYSFAEDVIESGKRGSISSELKQIDRWMLSRIQGYIHKTNIALDSIQTREAIQNSFFLLINDVKWYQRRGGENLLYYVLDNWVRLLTPFIPHICEEIWEAMGHKDPISLVQFPLYNEDLINDGAELFEEIIKDTLDDIEEIIRVTKMIPQKVHLYTAPAWKVSVIKKYICDINLKASIEAGTFIKTLMVNPELRVFGKEIPKFVQKIDTEFKSGGAERYEIFDGLGLDEQDLLKESASFLEKVIGCPVEIHSADSPAYDPETKSRFAEPLRPAIYIEGRNRE